MSCVCKTLNRQQVEESIKRITRFPAGFPKRIETQNKCCQEWFDWTFLLCENRAKELSPTVPFEL